MAKRAQEFESDHRSKASRLDSGVDGAAAAAAEEDDDDLNLEEEEEMQVDEELCDNLLEYGVVEEKDIDTNSLQVKEFHQKDEKENNLRTLNKEQEATVVTSLCDPKDSEHHRRNGLKSGASGEGKKNHENGEVLYSRTKNGKENGEKNGSTLQKKHEPRGYQLELADPAIKGLNSIICAPTGSGKTMTACLVCKSLSEKKAAAGQPFKAVFVVCLRNLVAQQRSALRQFLPDVNVGILDDQEFLEDVLRVFDVVVLTSQILVNALEEGDVKLKDLSLVILDECHHTNLDHPYNKLMQFYHLEKMKGGSTPLPQILGMTASLGVGSASNLAGAKNHCVQICANLDCTRISNVRDARNKEELEGLNPKPSQNQIKMVDKRPENKEFYQVMAKLMKDIEMKYLKDGVIQASRGTQRYESAVSTLKQEAEKTKEAVEEMVASEVLAKMNAAWMIHDELRTKDALQLLDKYFCENLESKPGAVERDLCQFYSDARHDLERIESQETLKDWPLLKELHHLLEELFEENAESHGIVMATTIQYVDGLLSFLHDYSPSELVFPKKFVGHRHNIENSMTEKQQEDVLLQFRNGNKNLLVSTDVTQEGLDIPHCNFVVRFNFVSNEIGAVQAKGRARAPDSKCFLIANRDSVNVEREMKNIGKERLMLEALDNFVSSSDEELQELIKKRQDDLYKKLRPSGSAMDVASTGDNRSHQYSIHCRRCKAFLCSADQLALYGSHYISTDEGFKERVIIERDPSPMEFRDETMIGKTFCRGNDCKTRIGSFMTYKRGSRPDGYNLGKDSVMWKARDKEQYGAIKKWKNVPFEIRQETRNA